ncbi:hypothetical protein PRK78_001977 [Emydomyces testavorans]|uniref:Uncharacterized protein n=1 Tax=Emydomyces testavorans TaxID=2070801 RepID=A0AAF0IHE2_9EURO|nr:hypothetical protein PRK78_001977 [Emydomyces testavorans]
MINLHWLISLELHMALIAASLPKLAPLFKSFLIPPQTRSTSQRTTSTYNSRQPERLRLFPLSKARSRPQRPRRPSTVRTEPSDFDKNPGNRPLACNYKVEVTTLNKYNKSRTSSFGAYRPNTNVDDCEAEDTISCVPAAYMANASSSEEHNGICLATPSSGIIRRTDIYVSMDDALDEDCEDIDDEGTERRRSKWNC